MKKTLLSIALVALLLAANGYAQTAMTQTTLTVAVGLRDSTISVASATNVAAGGIVFADKEAFAVTAINTATLVADVRRGVSGTKAATHAAGVVAYAGTPDKFGSSDPSGSCVAAAQRVLPLVIPSTGHIAACIDSQWAVFDPGVYAYKSAYYSAPLGSVAYGSVGTETTQVAGTSFCANIDLPGSKLLTGLKVLNGATVGTNKWRSYLYPHGGATVAAIASSAAAGANTSGADALQALAFSATIIVPPGRYWGCIQGNGATDKLRTVAASTFVDLLGDSFTGTFGTALTLTPPTTLEANKAPYIIAY